MKFARNFCFIRILSIVVLFLPVELQSACVPITTSCQTNCTGFTQSYNDANNLLYGEANCTDPCACSNTDVGSPCVGCGYQTKRQSGFCFSDTGCSSPCTPVPEINNTMIRNFFYLFSTMLVLGFISQIKWKKGIKNKNS